MELPSHVVRALSALEGAGWESYAVGGCVRDALLGLRPHDWDLTTAALPEQVEAVFAGERLLETGIRHGTVTLLTENGPLEITTFRTDGHYSDARHPDSVEFVRNIREDLRRRDFTVNAMAYSPSRGLRDDFGGQEDLRAGLLRCVGEPKARFTEDALRVLRALRFAARYRFTVEPETAAALRRHAALLSRVSPERVFSELKQILCAPGAGDMLRAFPEVFFAVLPEMEPMLGFDQHKSAAHQWDVWGHTAAAVDAAEPESVLRLTMLFHDCGKPETFSLDGAGEGHFYGHPAAGAVLADKMLRRLRCDTATRETVVTLVENHEMRTGHDRVSLRALTARLGAENIRRLLKVRRADAMAHAPQARERILAKTERDEQTLREILSGPACLRVKELAVCGGELLSLGVAPGPAVRELQETLLWEIWEEKLPNEREALLRRAEEIKGGYKMDQVKITWLGHACFKMEYKDWSLVIDPYADGSVDGLPPLRTGAGTVYCSHGHHDHNAVEVIALDGTAPPEDFAVETVSCPHDDAGGAKRGPNNIHIFRFGALRVVHMGDAGCLPDAAAMEKLHRCDLLLLPIGGFFTIDAAQARQLVGEAEPRAWAPMHYRGEGFGYGVLETLDRFASFWPEHTVTRLHTGSFTLSAHSPVGLVIPTLEK